MPSKRPYVSIIMNCFNGISFIEDAVDSVISQSYQDWELIFWDNRSTDGSIELMKHISAQEPRIKVFQSEKHTPLGAARRKAIEKSVGEWIAFLDVDDIWSTEKLARQLATVSDDRGMLGLTYTNIEVLQGHIALNKNEEDGRKKTQSLNPLLIEAGAGAYAFKAMLFECYVPLPSAIIRREAYFKVGGIDADLEVAEDYDLFLKISNEYCISSVREALSIYRIHASNLSFEKYWKTYEESLTVIKNFRGDQNIFVDLAILSWKGKYVLAALKRKDWSRLGMLLKDFGSFFGLLFYVFVVRTTILFYSKYKY